MDQDTKQGAEHALGPAAAEALRHMDEVRELLTGAAQDDLAGLVAQVNEKLDASRASLERAAHRKGASLSRTLEAREAAVREELEKIEKRVQANPVGALLVAGGIGLLLGLLLSRR